MAQPTIRDYYDPLITFADFEVVRSYGDTALVGNWFVFLKAGWFQLPEVAQLGQLFQPSDVVQSALQAKILFRGKDTITLPGVRIMPKPLPRPSLISLTCDKALYRAGRDTVRLLIAAPQQPGAQLSLSLRLGGNPYASYPLALDEYGLLLWSMRDLPEGEYVAALDGVEAEVCRFEVAEYRLAALNAELVEQQFSGDILRYTLSITSFNQPYSGSVEVELQERGQRVGERVSLRCDRDGLCRGSVKLSGTGPFTLNVIAGERSATVALKGSEQPRRESLTISELGELRVLSLLPQSQSNACRGMYITRGGNNTEPFIVRRVIGDTVEITPRVNAEALHVVVVDPTKGSISEHTYSQTVVEQPLRLPVPQPYGLVLLGAMIDGEAWEGWCAILRPSALQLTCEAPQQARPGERITLTLRTGKSDTTVPVQVIVKDQRLSAPSDPQVELAARIKQNLTAWSELSRTGKVERQLVEMVAPRTGGRFNSFVMRERIAFPPGIMPSALTTAAPMGFAGPVPPPVMQDTAVASANINNMMFQRDSVAQQETGAPVQVALTNVRVQFPEVVYNSIVKVRGETHVEVKLGDSLTRYGIEAFALDPETTDWQRVEANVDVVQPVYGELTVAPFVFPGDAVLGRLDVGAASGAAIVEVRHDGEVLPLFLDDGTGVTPGLPIPSGSVVRFPVRPGAFTATVRDARSGESDVSERYVTEPGQLRHIVLRLQLLQAGDELTLQALRQQGVLEMQPMPALERPFQNFVEGAIAYPFGCIEQTSCKLLAMFAGYIVYQDEDKQRAHVYEEVIPVWFKRLESMSLPNGAFCFYPPQEGGRSEPDTHYGPLGARHLLNLPTPERSGIKQPALLGMLTDVHRMASSAAQYYKLDDVPHTIEDCHSAYRIMTSLAATEQERAQALAFVRARLLEHNGQTYVEVADRQSAYNLFGAAVSRRAETAYAGAALLAGKEPGDLKRAIAATNYLTAQINEAGRLYSTVDTAACLILLLGLRAAGIVAAGSVGRIVLNGQEMALAEALTFAGKVESLACVSGVVAVQITSEVIENWSTFKSKLAVEVRLEKRGHIQEGFQVGDELELIIRVPSYEPGLLAHVCLPDALARIVGGGQVKRFSLDFSEKNELRIPLAAVGTTALPVLTDAELRVELQRRLLGTRSEAQDEPRGQHWAVLVRNMFKEEQVGNPGLLTVRVDQPSGASQPAV